MKTIEKKEFCELLREMKKFHENDLRLYDLGVDTDRMELNTWIDPVINLLQYYFFDDFTIERIQTDISYYDLITYFIYELDFGEKWEYGAYEVDGKDVRLDSPEALYDQLVIEMEEIENA